MIIENRIKCKHCGDLIYSLHKHDYKVCSCGAVGVDGGTEYLNRMFTTSPTIDYEELSIIAEEDLK